MRSIKIDTQLIKQASAASTSTLDKSRALAQKLEQTTSKKKTQKIVRKKTQDTKASAESYKHRDIKEFFVQVEDKDALSDYERRLYLKRAYNSDEEFNECDRALTTFYRINNVMHIYNRSTALELMKQYIAEKFNSENNAKDYFTSSEIEQHYEVFGPSISDNTLSAARKLQRDKIVKLEAIMCSETSTRVKYYKIHVVKQAVAQATA